MVWLPVLPVCAVFRASTQWCGCQCLGFFNVRTDVDACDYTRGLYGHRKSVCIESCPWEKTSLRYRDKWCTYDSGMAAWCHMKLLSSRRVLCTPHNHAPCHCMQIAANMCLAVPTVSRVNGILVILISHVYAWLSLTGGCAQSTVCDLFQ